MAMGRNKLRAEVNAGVIAGVAVAVAGRGVYGDTKPAAVTEAPDLEPWSSSTPQFFFCGNDPHDGLTTAPRAAFIQRRASVGLHTHTSRATYIR